MTEMPGFLFALAEALCEPLYAVGGVVRDALRGLPIGDIDLCAPLAAERALADIEGAGLPCRAKLRERGIGTLDIAWADGEAEYTAFRTDVYAQGAHRPVRVEATRDIALDAARRDFTVNALYFDLRARRVLDPLGRGVSDLAARRLDTTRAPDAVLGEDGLRLLRLARFAAQLDFDVAADVLSAARRHGALLLNISPERRAREVLKIYDTPRPQRALALLSELGLLDIVFEGHAVDVDAPTLALALRGDADAEGLLRRWGLPRALRAELLRQREEAQ